MCGPSIRRLNCYPLHSKRVRLRAETEASTCETWLWRVLEREQRNIKAASGCCPLVSNDMVWRASMMGQTLGGTGIAQNHGPTYQLGPQLFGRPWGCSGDHALWALRHMKGDDGPGVHGVQVSMLHQPSALPVPGGLVAERQKARLHRSPVQSLRVCSDFRVVRRPLLFRTPSQAPRHRTRNGFPRRCRACGQ